MKPYDICYTAVFEAGGKQLTTRGRLRINAQDGTYAVGAADSLVRGALRGYRPQVTIGGVTEVVPTHAQLLAIVAQQELVAKADALTKVMTELAAAGALQVNAIEHLAGPLGELVAAFPPAGAR